MFTCTAHQATVSAMASPSRSPISRLMTKACWSASTALTVLPQTAIHLSNRLTKCNPFVLAVSYLTRDRQAPLESFEGLRTTALNCHTIAPRVPK